ncbi:spore protease YyaC [Bacillus anthracis]|uniref:Spore protease YyaC n=1 Tax=Bacillus tropicus TaxID=2026188 RepID=A0A7T2QCN8_9BACI|nr:MULTISPECIES: spore protease YyaC [Bacillus]AIY75825.1 putative sporulation protein YyaC [Bacillus cereus]AJI05872.1 putative sporulation protein YyaC [Bacillus cereus G9241]PED54441.1 spore protease YyaC [Bacillus anthracis]AJG92936.1 putative sporulation protein YyaC [Bacillus cereus]ARO21108.1 spore protease YyaC [Bacillus cereus]
MNIGSFRLPFFEKETQNVMHQDLEASETISNFLLSHIPIKTHIPIILICIGTDRSTGDALGPLVGTKLEQVGIKNFQVFGTLDDPVHALNLEEKFQNIQKDNPTSFIIAVDACLGKSQSIGSITTGMGPSKPGAAMNKKLPAVGDLHIHGIVNLNGFMEFFVLQNTRLSLVMKMADVIAQSIKETDQKICALKKANHL